MQSSPIRKNINSLDPGQLSIFEDKDGKFEGDAGSKRYVGIRAKEILADVLNMEEAIEHHTGDKTRIAIMGEVKAGKSTFMNAVIGKEVAYTDVLEATSIVAEVVYSDDEYVKLLDKEGNVEKTMSVEDMLEWMEDLNDLDDDEKINICQKYSKMEVGINSDILQDMIFVDTPGLFSITAKNHNITNEYVRETDYILWVIDSGNLGSKEVNDYIDKIRDSGKPMIGIINKVDNPENRIEIEDYIRQEYGAVFEDIFFVSAKKAWKLRNSGGEGWDDESGIADVIDYINDIACDKEYSVDKTMYYQYQRDKEVHVQLRERVKERKVNYDANIASFSDIHNRICKEIRSELRRWRKKEFFINEREELYNANKDQFNELLEKYSDRGYLTDLLDEKSNEITDFIQKKWEIVERSLSITLSQVLIDFSYDKSIVFEEDTEVERVDEAGRAENIKHGLKMGTAIGIALTGYWAWLGPAAATATFVGSFVPFTAPLAIGGAFIGALATKKIRVDNSEINQKRMQELADDLYREVLKAAEVECDEIEKALIACSEKYYLMKKEEFKRATASLNFDFEDPGYSAFMEELDSYLKELDGNINRLSAQNVPEPPGMEDFADPEPDNDINEQDDSNEEEESDKRHESNEQKESNKPKESNKQKKSNKPKESHGTDSIDEERSTIEEILLQEINKVPKTFDYNVPELSSSLLEAYVMVVRSFIGQVVTADSVKMLKLALNAKRARNNTTSKYNECLENNIVFELYKYDNFLGIFDLFKNRSVNLEKVDMAAFNTLMIEDSQKKVKSAQDFSKSNQAIKKLLNNYKTTDTEHREYDYIFSSLKVQAVGVAIQSVLFGKMEIDNKAIDALGFFSQYPSKSNKSALDMVITDEIVKRLSVYY